MKAEGQRNISLLFNRTSRRFFRGMLVDPLSISFVGLTTIFVFLFYTTNFRQELENFFHDVRLRLMPESSLSSHVSVVTIDNVSISKLERDSLRLRVDANKQPYLNLRTLTQTAGILANTEASAIVLLMPEHAFPPDDPDMAELRDIIKFDPRFVVGTTGYHQTIPNLKSLPSNFSGISSQTAAAETFRSRSNAIIRQMPYLSYLGLHQTVNLAPKIASMTNPNFALKSGNYLIKFNSPKTYRVTKIEDLVNTPEKTMGRFKDNVVVVGYSVPRSIGVQTTEQSFANTPLTGYAPTNVNGISTTFLIANAIDNLVKGESLSLAPVWLTILQTTIIALTCALSWEFGGFAAWIVTALVWCLLLAIHAALYRWASLSIPLADTFLATALISLFAASRKLKLDLKALAEQKVSTQIKSELARFQSHFLSGFATWVSATTETISNLVTSVQKNESTSDQDKAIYDRLYLAASDLNEYLAGINQLSQADESLSTSMKLDLFEVKNTVNSVLRRFEAKSQMRGIRFDVRIDDNLAMMKSNQQIIDSILFNFISNAVKYANPNSTVDIRVQLVDRREVIFSVSDEGPGIPPHLQNRVFERFYRINDERLYSAKGTGVGLYLCRFFAESLGGRVDLTSSVNSGSEFRAIIPWLE